MEFKGALGSNLGKSTAQRSLRAGVDVKHFVHENDNRVIAGNATFSIASVDGKRVLRQIRHMHDLPSTDDSDQVSTGSAKVHSTFSR